MPDSDWLNNVRERLLSTNFTDREAAVDDLGTLGIVDSLTLLAEAAESSHPRVKERALEALWDAFDDIVELGLRDTVEPLLRLLRAETDSYRRGAHAYRLESLPDPRFVPWLIELLDDEDRPNVPWKAIHALGVIGDARAVEPLARCLNDPDSCIRLNAAEALAWIGEPARKALIERKSLIVEQLGQIASALGGDPRAALREAAGAAAGARPAPHEADPSARVRTAADFDYIRNTLTESDGKRVDLGATPDFYGDPAWYLAVLDVAIAAVDVAYLAESACLLGDTMEFERLEHAVRRFLPLSPNERLRVTRTHAGSSQTYASYYHNGSPAGAGGVNSSDAMTLVNLRALVHEYVRTSERSSRYQALGRSNSASAIGMLMMVSSASARCEKATTVGFMLAMLDVAEAATVLVQSLWDGQANAWDQVDTLVEKVHVLLDFRVEQRAAVQ